MENFLSVSGSFNGFKSIEVLSFFLFEPKEHDIALDIFPSNGILELRKLSFGTFQFQSQSFYFLPATFVRHFLGIFKVPEFLFEFFIILLQESISQFFL